MKKFFLLNLVAAGLLILLFLQLEAAAGISAENGLLENLQASFLGAEIVLLWVGGQAWIGREDASAGLLFSVGLFTLLLRELDLERLPVPNLVVVLGSGLGRNLLLALLWLAVLVALVKRRARLPAWIRQGFAAPWGWALLLGAGTYLLAAAFDQKVVPLPRSERLFWEEALETVAVIWLGLGVLLWAFRNRYR